MADQKISELTALTGANVADDDAIAIVDTSATETKKIVFSELKNALDTATGFVRITGDTMTGALDVQSTITSDGLTVDGAASINGANLSLDNAYYLAFRNAANTSDITTLTFDANDQVVIDPNQYGTVIGTSANPSLKVASNRDISFYEDTGTTPKFFWDAADERLGLGTTNAAAILHLTKSSDTADIKLESSGGSGRIYTIQSRTDGNFSIVDSTAGGVQRVTMDSSGNVGIGTSSPTEDLHVSGTADQTIAVESTSTGAGANAGIKILAADGGDFLWQTGNATGNALRLYDLNASSERMRIDSSGNVGIGTSSPQLDFVVSNNGAQGFEINSSGLISGGIDVLAYNRSTSAYAPIYNNASYHVWATSTSEAMRIDSSGHAIIPAGVTLGTAAGVYAAANTLDDYEEGTWTPTSQGSGLDPTIIRGNVYTKVGNLVTVQVEFQVPTNSNTAQAFFGGLPFPTRSDTTYRISANAATNASGYAVTAYLLSGVSYFGIYQLDGLSGVTYQNLSGKNLTVNITYMTAE